MNRELLPIESYDGAPYPEGRNAWGLADVSVCGPVLMTAAELEFLVQAIPQRGRYCEIGSWCSAGLSWIADRRPEVYCVGVDCFEGPPNRRLFAALANWDQRPNVDLFLGRVENFAWRDSYFDVVLVDGDHRADAVYRDLSIAAEMAKSAAIVFAHDYGSVGHPEVQQAVAQFCEEAAWAIVGRVDSLVKLQWAPL